MSDDTRGGSAFSWFLAGLGLGSLIGVLYAPKAGQETRDELVAGALGSSEYVRQRSREATRAAGEYVERSRDQVNEYVARGRDQANEYVSTGRDHLNHLVNQSKDAVEAGRQKINDAYNQSRQAVAEQKEKLAAAYDAGKSAYVETVAPELPHDELIPGSESYS